MPSYSRKLVPRGKSVTFLNVGTGKDITIRDLTQLIAELIGYRGNIKWNTDQPDGTPKKLLDIERIKSTGWNYQIELKDGLKSTIKNYIENANSGKIRK